MNVVVVGGGTAGWITALMAQKELPAAEITLVESADIGILGAGEGTTPHFLGMFLEPCGIGVPELVKHVGATIKAGIRFTNWSGDGATWFHPFGDLVTPGHDYFLLHPDRALRDEDLILSARACALGRVPFTPRYTWEQDPNAADPLRNLVHHSNFALHFDAVRLAAYLGSVAVGRGVRRVEGLVVDVVQAPDGDVRELVLKDGRRLPCDFVFDCSGFRRLLLGEVFEADWIDARPALPVDRALPFFMPYTGNADPCTDAIAMKAGWMWKIPVEGRYGCGYVFDSAFQDVDGARAEIQAMFPGVEPPRVLSFAAGYFDRIWIRNCFGVGLSTGFLEPLEATSIWVTVVTLRELFRAHLGVGDDRARAAMNGYFRSLMGRIVDFLHAHYLTVRRDTPFWATFRERTTLPEGTRDLLGDSGIRWQFEPTWQLGGDPLPFGPPSWMALARGVGLLDRESIARQWHHRGLWDGWEARFAAHRSRIDRIAEGCVEHEVVLAALRRAP